MNKPQRPPIKSITVPFHKLPSAVQTRVLLAKSRSAELADIINELVPNALSAPSKDGRISALKKELTETRKALDAAMMLLNYYKDPLR